MILVNLATARYTRTTSPPIGFRLLIDAQSQHFVHPTMKD